MCRPGRGRIHELYERAELHAVHRSVHPRTAATAPAQVITLEDPGGYHVELATYTPEDTPV